MRLGLPPHGPRGRRAAPARWRRDGVIITAIRDAAGEVIEYAKVTRDLTERHADGRGGPLSAVFHIISEETRRVIESPVDRVLREGIVVGLAGSDGHQAPGVGRLEAEGASGAAPCAAPAANWALSCSSSASSRWMSGTQARRRLSSVWTASGMSPA